MRVLITGAFGSVGKLLQAGLHNRYELRLADIAPGKSDYSQDIRIIDINKPETLIDVMAGVDYVIHLAAIADEIEDWQRILETNIIGTANVFAAAKQANVKRVIFASSIQAVGFYPRSQTLHRQVMPRPSGFYGASKVACEALARLYADKYNLSVICIRINSLEPRPHDTRELVTWLSEGDAVNLFIAAIEAPAEVRFDVIYGVSNNSQRAVSNHGTRVRFTPKDNAETFRQQIEADGLPEGEVAKHFHGGPFCQRRFDGDLKAILSERPKVQHNTRSTLFDNNGGEEKHLRIPTSKL